jgi:hypothetical protein
MFQCFSLHQVTGPNPQFGDGGVDLFEEGQHVLGGVALVAVGQDLPGGEVHRGEQVSGAVALVVMGHRAVPAGNHGQARLGAVHGLALGFLTEAEYRGPSRRVHIQANDIDQLLLKAGVVGNLEGVHPPGLEVVVGSDPGDGVLAGQRPTPTLFSRCVISWLGTESVFSKTTNYKKLRQRASN